ncbi:MAG: hypothetical protein KIT67_15610 [Alphaproteobacteria bacterium]|nr:hypothetical protein [Alphaproteobacteria bacterium]
MTKLTLTVQQKHGSTSFVLFAFGPSPLNPNVPEGSFMMQGTLSDSMMQLTPMNWVKEPYGFSMIGLVGTSTDGKSYQGNVVASIPGCSTFSVVKK